MKRHRAHHEACRPLTPACLCLPSFPHPIVDPRQDASAAGKDLAKAGKAPGCCGRKLSTPKSSAKGAAATAAGAASASAGSIKPSAVAPTIADSAPSPAPAAAAAAAADSSAAASTAASPAAPARSAWDLDGDGVVEASEIASIVKDKVAEQALLWRNGLELAVVHFFKPFFA